MNKLLLLPILFLLLFIINSEPVKADLPNNTFMEDETVVVWIYCMNQTNSPCYAADVSCEITAFYPNTSTLVNQVPMLGNGTDGFYNYSFGVLPTRGIYSALTYCNGTDEGVISFDFTVGYDEDFYDQTFWFYVFLFALPIILYFISWITDDKWFLVFAGISLITFALYIQANGFPNFSNFLLETAAWTILLGLGLYVMVKNTIELIEG